MVVVGVVVVVVDAVVVVVGLVVVVVGVVVEVVGVVVTGVVVGESFGEPEISQPTNQSIRQATHLTSKVFGTSQVLVMQ